MTTTPSLPGLDPATMPPMRILKFLASNLKRLTVVEITPAGDVVTITGPNESGKTTTLDAIWYALDGARNVQKMPIRKGEEKALIKLDLGAITVTRTFTAKGSYLTVHNEAGEEIKSPQKLLDALVGELSFDPLKFAAMTPIEQSQRLQNMLGLDATAMRAAHDADMEARKLLSRDAKLFADQAAGFAVPDGTPAEKIDTAALEEGLDEAVAANAAGNAARQRKAAIEQRIAKLRDELDELEAEMPGQIAAAAIPLVDILSLRERIREAQRLNDGVANRARRDEARAKAKTASDAAERLTLAMDTRISDFKKKVAAAKLPVDGLTLDPVHGVMFGGIPFEQASTAVQIRVSCAVAMAANPKIRVIRIKDGSLIDKNGLAIIAQMAASNGYQIWLEALESDDPTAVRLEEGVVVGAAPATPAAKESA